MLKKLSLKLELYELEDQWTWHISHRENQIYNPIEIKYNIPNQQAIEKNIAAFLNKGRWDLDEIQKYGSNISQELLPRELINIFQQYTTGEILFLVPPRAADLPFEFLYIPNMGFLNLYFQIGICIYISKDIGHYQSANKVTAIRKNDKFLIISNPDHNKKVIHHESGKVKTVIKKNNCSTYLIATDSKKRIIEALQKTSIVHFSAQSSDTGNLHESGWELSKGITFTINDIKKLENVHRVPWLIFSNSCEAGRFGNSSQISGIAGAFLKAGVNNFIAPSIKVNSRESLIFALLFYKYLFIEKFPALALFYARKKMAELYPNSITPFLYRFYGDPVSEIRPNIILKGLKYLYAAVIPITVIILFFMWPREMKIYTSFAANEYEVYKNIVNIFEKKNKIKIKILNLAADTLIDYLNKNKAGDLVHIDINKINDIKLNEKLVNISKHKDLIPQDMDNTMLNYIQNVEKYQGITSKHLIPFRNNVKLLIINKIELDKIFHNSPDEREFLFWDTFLHWAKKAKTIKGKPMFILPGKGDGAALFLVEFIRSVGGNPMDLNNPLTRLALDSLRSIWPSFVPGNYNETNGSIISGKAIAGLNWSFMFFNIKTCMDKYLIYSGLKWDQDNHPSNILGGECIAIPKKKIHINLKNSIKLIRFLISVPIQEEFNKELGWPPLRMEVLNNISKPYLDYYYPIMQNALLFTEPVPVEWNTNIKNCFLELFNQITNSSNDMDILVSSTQSKINSFINNP